MTEVDLPALRRGDQAAFLNLVNAYHSSLLRLALIYSPNREVAEESVQETWLAALRGLDGFAERAKLRTWLCRILINIARRRAAAESRALPFSSLAESDFATVSADPDRFLQSGHWVSPPADWSSVPEHRFLSTELQNVVSEIVATLPDNQAIVISLRDIEGWGSDEVSELLEISGSHQRVLLHRARGKVRAALESYLMPDAASA